MEADNIYVSELEDKDYISKVIGKYQKDFSEIKNIKLEEIIEGPINFALLKKIGVFDYEDKSISELFAKIYDPSRPNVYFSMQDIERDKRFGYAAMHQRFWNDIEIPSPTLYDFVDKEKYKFLIMGYWSEPSHAIDISVIKDAIEKREEDIKKGTILDKSLLEKLNNENKFFSGELDKITRSMLHTINRIGVIGTAKRDEYNNLNKDFYVYESLKKEDYIKKIERYIKNIILRQSILKGDVRAEIVRKHIESDKISEYLRRWLIKPFLPRIVKKDVTDITTMFKELFDPLIQDILDKTDFVYSQGDGHPYHFKYRNFEKDGKIELRSGILDSCRSRIEPRHLPKTKPLLSYLLDLDYNKVHDFFLESLVEEENLKAITDNKEIKISNVKDLGEEHIKEATKHFDIWSLFESICAAGRESVDELINQAFHYDLVNRREIYKNPFLPEVESKLGKNVSVSYSRHDADYAIGKLTKRMNERLELMLDKKTIYSLDDREIELIDGIKKLCDETLFKTNGAVNGKEDYPQEGKSATG